MSVTPEMICIVCPLVFLASFIDAIGGGGGLISLPAYYLAGLPAALAAGSNKLSACVGSFSAAVSYLRKGKLLVVPALFAIAGALPGAYAGAEGLKRTDEGVVRLIMVILIPLVAVLVAFKGAQTRRARASGRATRVLCLFSGLAVGFYDGFFGPGAGPFYIVLFTWLCGMDTVTASGTAKPVNFASNIAALVSLMLGGQVLYALAAPAMAFSALGGYLGSRAAIKNGAKFIRYVMLIVMAAILVKLAVEWFL